MNNIDKKEILEFFSDTSKLLSKVAIAVGSNNISSSYVENVEFWKWMQRNYEDLSSSEALAEYLSKEGNKNQFYGKLFEWDVTNAKRDELANLFSRFDLSDNPTQEGVDLIEHRLFGGDIKYQIKSYLSGTPHINVDPSNPDTIPDIVVTNEENVLGVAKQGYKTETFMDAESIKHRRDEVMESVENGYATPNYEFFDVAEKIGKSALFGAVIGVGMETLISYHEYKNGNINSLEYLDRIKKSGAERGITAGATTGVMIPINALFVDIGIAGAPITIPIAFIIHHTVAAPISAAFGKGEYKTALNDARLYDNTAEMMRDFAVLTCETNANFASFLETGRKSDEEFVKYRDAFEDGISELEKMVGGKF